MQPEMQGQAGLGSLISHLFEEQILTQSSVTCSQWDCDVYESPIRPLTQPSEQHEAAIHDIHDEHCQQTAGVSGAYTKR